VHELSLCQNLIDQLNALVLQHKAIAVSHVEVQAGMLSGVEPELLEAAFTMAREGTVAETAELVMRKLPPRILCSACGSQAEVPPNDLRCPMCQASATELIAGHELILARVELVRE